MARLMCLFLPAEYLAELAMKLLVSSHIHSALVAIDDRASPSKDGYKYPLETLEISGFGIRSPVAFIVDRLRRALTGEISPLPNDYRSAWVFLVCASANFGD